MNPHNSLFKMHCAIVVLSVSKIAIKKISFVRLLRIRVFANITWKFVNRTIGKHHIHIITLSQTIRNEMCDRRRVITHSALADLLRTDL